MTAVAGLFAASTFGYAIEQSLTEARLHPLFSGRLDIESTLTDELLETMLVKSRLAGYRGRRATPASETRAADVRTGMAPSLLAAKQIQVWGQNA